MKHSYWEFRYKYPELSIRMWYQTSQRLQVSHLADSIELLFFLIFTWYLKPLPFCFCKKWAEHAFYFICYNSVAFYEFNKWNSKIKLGLIKEQIIPNLYKIWHFCTKIHARWPQWSINNIIKNLLSKHSISNKQAVVWLRLRLYKNIMKSMGWGIWYAKSYGIFQDDSQSHRLDIPV